MNQMLKFTQKYTVLLLLILAVATVLRMYKLDFKSLWLDELYSVVPTNPQNSIDFIIQYCKSDQPPVYFLLLHFWFKTFAYNSFYARLLSVAIGVVSVAAMYFLGKEVKNERVGIFASLLTCVNYFLIYYSQESRFYILLFLLTILSFLFFIRSLKHKTLINYFLYLISTVALLYTHYFGIMVPCIQGLIFVIYVFMFKPGTRFVITGIILALLVSCSIIPWLPTIIYDSNITSYWIQQPKPYFLAIYYYLYWGKDAVLSGILLIVGFVYLRQLTLMWKDRKNYQAELFTGILLILWIGLTYLIPYVRSVISTPVLIPRYTLVALPAIILIMALGFDLIEKRSIKTIVVVVVFISALTNLFFVRKHYVKLDKAQWREAAQAVIDRYEPNVKVYSNLEWWYNFYFYFTDPHIKVVGTFSSNEAREQQPFIDEIGGEQQFWVLSGEGMNGLNTLQQEYVNKHFKVKESYTFFAASAVLYERIQ